MSSGFAGAQRLDERRRRRLINQDAKESPARTAPQDRQGGQSPDFDPTGPIRDLSLGVLVPTSLWRHVVLCLAGFVAAIAVLTGSIYADDAARVTGRSWEALLGAGVGSLRTWWISVALFFQAQLALVIFWVRSHSLRDFEGRYHLWTRVALAAMAWGMCAVTSVHTVAAELLVARLGWSFPLASTWAWMAPVALAVALLTWGLHRELSACRGSDTALFCAMPMAAAYALISLKLIPLPRAWEPARLLILDGLTMTGIWTVCVAFLIHARYVIHLSAEPVPVRTWSFRIPRPHWLKLGRLPRRSATATDGENSAETASTEAAASTRPPRAKPARRTKLDSTADAEAVSTELMEPAVVTATTPTLKPTAPTPPPPSPATSIPTTPTPAAAKKSSLRLDASPVTSSPVAPAAPPAPSGRSEPAAAAPASRILEIRQPEARQHVVERIPHVEPTYEEPDGDADSDDGEESDSAEFRGMSKKQRRKLLAQQRDRDRRGGK